MRPGLRVAALLVIGVVAACAAHHPPTVQLAGLNWLSADTDPVSALTTQPATCLKPDSQTAAGELLFNSPLLLGGQAAKAGLSCASCHQNGRGNPHFVFNGISGQPGTADVTNGLFSRVRADGTFNPVAIPDLASPSGKTRVDRTRPGALEAFLNAQIIEEFEGARPTATMVDALAAYIRALDDSACQGTTTEAVTWQQEFDRIESGLQELDRTGQADPRTAAAYTRAIRAALGRLHARYPGNQHRGVRTGLEHISQMLRDGAPTSEVGTALITLKPQLAKYADTSLYDPGQFRRMLAAADP